MIDRALELIVDELNVFLGRKEPRYRNEDTAILSDIVDQKGETVVDLTSPAGHDALLVTLINVEEETFGKAQLPHLRRPDDTVDVVNPEVKINLFVLFSAFSGMNAGERYRNCLRLVGLVVRFFQQKHVFDHQSSPGLAPEIEALWAELVSPTFEQQSYLWGALGAKYAPSVLYRIRLLRIRETDEALEGPLVEEIHRGETATV